MKAEDVMLTEIWGKVYVNGSLTDAGSAAVSALDRGFLYGDGVFETLRVYKGRPFMLDAHIKRMYAGCELISLHPPEEDMIRDGIAYVLQANNLDDAYLRITVTRGVTGRMWSDLSGVNPCLFIMAKPYTPPSFGEGFSLMVSEFRTDERSPLSGIKHIGILPKILARRDAVRMGFDDALLLNTGNFVSEATSSNVFWFSEGALFTPGLNCGVLPGITRRVVMGLAESHGLKVVEGEFNLDEAESAEEMFLTSSTWEIAHVRSLNGKKFESPGRVTEIIRELYHGKIATI